MDIQFSSVAQGNGAEVAHQARPDVSVQTAGTVVAQAKAVMPVSSAVSQEQINNAVSSVNQVVQKMPHGSTLEFTVDKDTSHNVIKVVDKVTDEIIRQFPSEEVLNIAKVLDRLQGMLIRDKA